MTSELRRILSIVVLFQGLVFAQFDSTKIQFYPLHIGDMWQYRGEGGGLFTYRIVGETVVDGRHYFVFQNGSPVRIDSLYREALYQFVTDTCYSSGCNCIRQNNYEYGYYRLNEPVGSSYVVCENKAGALWSNAKPIMRYVSYAEDYAGPGRDAMIFHQEAVDTVTGKTSTYGFQFILVRGLGIYREEYEADRFIQLTGAIINGVPWGTLVLVTDGQSLPPRHYELGQNYPNPFNPSTTISYSLPKTATVSLWIFNTLGQEIATLVNERKEAGYYQATWNANVPSGIYFYRLQAVDASIGSGSGFLETKKMILLR